MVNLFKNLLLQNRPGSYMVLKLGMKHLGHKLYKVDINDDHGLTLPIIRHCQNWSNVHLNGKHCYKVIQWGKTSKQQMSKSTKDLYF